MSDPMRILLVEDDALILMQMEALLEDAGHRVVGTAMRTAEALELARTVRADIAFVDLRLAEGDSGLDVARTLQGEHGIMVMFVTANPLNLGDDFAGAAGVIAKPFTRAVVASGMPYLEECLRRPPSRLPLPRGMYMAPRYQPR